MNRRLLLFGAALLRLDNRLCGLAATGTGIGPSLIVPSFLHLR